MVAMGDALSFRVNGQMEKKEAGIEKNVNGRYEGQQPELITFSVFGNSKILSKKEKKKKARVWERGTLPSAAKL